MAIAMLIGAALICGYVAAAVYLTRAVWRLTHRCPDWGRVLLCTLVLTLFFAPGVVGAGHGAAIAPAWVALVDPGSNRFAIKTALISLAVTWGVLFLVGIVVRGITKHRTK
jgi:hypothetical protein